MELHTIGIDLGKTIFHLVGLNPRGEVVVRKKFSRKQLLHFTANLQATLFAIKQRKAVPHEFVLDAIAPLSPEIRSMFGCLALLSGQDCPHPPRQARWDGRLGHY
jgi:hypothetical protein